MAKANTFNVRALRLLGATRDYRVDFSDGPGRTTIRSLSIIAGEISTGKTTILEFIDWCLGAKEHPEHDEILANVRSAQLAIEVFADADADADADAEGPTQYVIERALGSASTKAFLYHGTLDEMSGSPVRSFTSDPADPESISYYLLQLCGLGGLRLDQAPTKIDSKTSVLSFRDLQPLWFLPNRRLDNGNLAYENLPHRSIKLNQVADILFGVSDNQSSALSRAVEEFSAEERELGRAVKTLEAFLETAGVADIAEVDAEADRLRVRFSALSARTKTIDSEIAARSEFTAELRSSFSASQKEAQALQVMLRDRESLATRIGSLRAQYADEIRRLDLVSESIDLFDSLAVVACPACQNDLQVSPSIVHEECTLCRSNVAASGGQTEQIDLSSERRSLSSRMKQLLQFNDEIRREAERLTTELHEAAGRVEAAQSALDSASSPVVVPYLAERDQVQQEVIDVRAELKALKQSRQMLEQLGQKKTEYQQVVYALKEAKERKANYLQTANPRDSFLANVGERLHTILVDFEYPKVDLVRVEKNLVPHVRGRRYDKVGSSGAMTLIALAWELAIFELAYEKGSGHPGFLLVDSPQKNLVPGVSRDNGDSEVRELDSAIVSRRRHIVENIYAHVQGWLKEHPGAQVIFVDNLPPAVVDENVVIRFSQQAEYPPYGLIDNEDGS